MPQHWHGLTTLSSFALWSDRNKELYWSDSLFLRFFKMFQSHLEPRSSWFVGSFESASFNVIFLNFWRCNVTDLSFVLSGNCLVMAELYSACYFNEDYRSLKTFLMMNMIHLPIIFLFIFLSP